MSGRQRELLIVAGLAERLFALPASAVERVERMAALTPMPDAPPGVAGLLNLRGALLAVVDPRPRLGLPTLAADPDQRLLIVRAGSRYALWVDRVEQIAPVRPDQLDAIRADDAALTVQLARIGAETVPVLSASALDPGPILQPSPAARC